MSSVATLHLFLGGGFEAVLRGVDRQFGRLPRGPVGLALAEVGAAGARGGNVLVALDALHDEDALEAVGAGGVEHFVLVRQMRDADDAVAGGGDVGDLLDRGEESAQGHFFSQLAGGVNSGHEAFLAHVAEAVALDGPLDGGRLAVDVDTERFKDVTDGDAVLGSHVLLAVEDDRRAGGGDDDGRGRTDDDALLAAVVGTADVEQAFDGRADEVGAGAIGVDEAEQLVDGLALVALKQQETAGLRGRGLAVEDEADGRGSFFAVEVAAGAGALADLSQVGAHLLVRCRLGVVAHAFQCPAGWLGRQIDPSRASGWAVSSRSSFESLRMSGRARASQATRYAGGRYNSADA